MIPLIGYNISVIMVLSIQKHAERLKNIIMENSYFLIEYPIFDDKLLYNAERLISAILNIFPIQHNL
jgi:hypothetical protein